MSAEPTTTAVSTPEERKKRYKASLNLPKTDFAMKANLAENEPRSQQRWNERGLYREVIAARRDATPFVFHDGPPYANGDIHVGHLLNKVLKDLVVRSRNLLGERCAYVPGWDCHGLPIEHKVMKDLEASGKAAKLAELEEGTRRMAVRRECARYASKYKEIQAKQMLRLSTLADYEDPYLTMLPGYERSVIEVFAVLVERGLVYRDLKPVHWSIANTTALAEAELEYRDREDPSVYVRFEAADPAAVARAFGVDAAATLSFLIWTTTPWTLPANMLIAVHPELRYQLVDLGGRPTVVAAARREAVAKLAGGEAKVLGEAAGSALLGLRYRHPFVDREGWIVGGDHVTAEDGTGLVHTATGHGHEDYLTGQREGVAPYCPVGPDGRYDASVPDWLVGKTVWEANPMVADHLAASGHLFQRSTVVHSYPHDWRSKTPVIFRCTEQWFVAVDKPFAGGGSLRERALSATDDGIDFVPGWGKNRLRGMLESRPDWCISRQRSWGLPIPAFRRADGSIFLTAKAARAVAEVFGREGSDAWFLKSAQDLLAGYDPASDAEAPAGLEVASLEKTFDIFDVWFESGSSWNAVLRARNAGYPADLYLEGSDQHRGWFQLSLLPALGATGEPPFRRLLTHGFIVDKDGKKMSKSGGNALVVEELLKHFGADVCRWWVASVPFENDIKVDMTFFEAAGESYRKVRNTLRFLLSNLAGFDPARDGVDLAAIAPASIDAWALREASALRTDVVAAYRAFAFRDAHLRLFDFCNDTLSAVYLDAVKDRLYCDRPDSPRRRACQTVLHRLAELLSTLLAPLLPHTADEAWRSLRAGDADACVHLETPPEIPTPADPGWERVMAAREAVSKALEDAKPRGIENKLDAGVTVPDPDAALGPFAPDLPDLFGVSRVHLSKTATGVEVEDLREAPRCERSWRRDETVRQREDGGWLSDRDAEAVGIG